MMSNYFNYIILLNQQINLYKKMRGIDYKDYESEYILSDSKLVQKIRELKKQNKKIGFCTGSFDLLHPGHINHLNSAKKICDILIVGVAKDSYSINKRPESGRPIYTHNLRAFMVSQLKSVDYVILEDGVIETLYLVKPDIYIKGKDYSDKKEPGIIQGEEIMKSLNGVIYFTKDEKLSTTEIIQHIKEEIR